MLYSRTLRCPRHHIVKPGKNPFQIEENPFTKDTQMSDADCKRFGIRKWKYKRDRFGRKIPNYNNHYQPLVSAAFVLEHIFDDKNPICLKCKKCLEGLGGVTLITKSPVRDGRTLKDITNEMYKQAEKEGVK